jgi:lipid II:glycine glycyltransferase (peptidoglycan interpeptide bridge formation enzyme)
MITREVLLKEKEQFNQVVTHPLQSWEWGEFKEKGGAEIIRLGQFEGRHLKAGFQIMIHSLPRTKYKIGYLPKCSLLDKQMFAVLRKIGQEHHCIFIKIEPQLIKGKDFFLANGCLAGRPLFTKYTFQIDLRQSEEQLLAKMKQKTRYNIKVAQKHEVKVAEDNSGQGFNEYLRLTLETTRRQKFYAHDEKYHRLMWKILYPAGIAYLLEATYQGKTLVCWIVFVFNQVLYYPYGASSREHREVMASSLMMWEAMRFGKKMGCQTFDLWGSLGPNPSPRDPWFGFHRFKEGFNPQLIEFIGTFDLVMNPRLYKIYNLADNLRWKYLKLKAFFQ